MSQIRPPVQFNRMQRAQLVGPAALVQDVGDRRNPWSTAFQNQADRGAKFRSAVVVEQLEQLSSRTTDGFAAAERFIQQGFTFRNSQTEAARRRGAQGTPFFIQQRLTVI